jgi:ubiquinone biosynthesis protein
MDELTAALAKHRKRLGEIMTVLRRYGLADWADRDGVAGVKFAQRLADPELAALSPGERMREAAVELGTTFVKFGQMLSLRPDVVGPEVASELEKLQASVPPDAPDVARRIVVEELGDRLEGSFARFEAEAMGSGSVAQVHAAMLHDGTSVVVKILHDGVERKVNEDLELMRALAQYVTQRDPELARYRPTMIVSEFDKMMRGAIDLGQERANLQRFTANFAAEPDVVIPTPYPEVSTSRVLTMSRLAGMPLEDRAGLEAAGWDVDALVRRASEVYLEMIFRDGVFHADPHPGNFMLLDGHRLGILDFGDVGYIGAPRREQLEELVIAAGTRNVDELTDTILEMTTPPPDVDVTQLRADVDIWLRRYFLAGVGHLDVTAILTSWSQMMHDYQLVLPSDLALLMRVLLHLQGLGRTVGTELRATELLAPYLRRIMVERFDPQRVARRALRTARAWDHLVQSLPEQIQATFERLRTGEVGVDFRIRDVDGAVDRLVDGLLASASLLAAAQLIARRAGPTIGGVSIAGLAVVGVGARTWQRLATSRRGRKPLLQRVRALFDLQTR